MKKKITVGLVILVGTAFTVLALTAGHAESSAQVSTSFNNGQGELTPTPHVDDQNDHSSGEDEPVYTDEMVAAGRDLFALKGCVACHGQQAEGTAIGPALAGHTEFQVRRQVRMPIGNMLVFSPDQLSDENILNLAAFIASLEPQNAMGSDNMSGMDMGDNHSMPGMDSTEEGHSMPGMGDMEDNHDMPGMDGMEDGHGGHSAGGPRDMMIPLHWLALDSLKNETHDETRHALVHVEEITETIHLALMQSASTFLEENDTESAQAILENMLADIDTEELNPSIAYLQLTVATLQNDELENAKHYFDHFLSLETNLIESATIEEIQEHFDEGDAEAIVERLAEFLPNQEDHTEDSDHADEDEHR